MRIGRSIPSFLLPVLFSLAAPVRAIPVRGTVETTAGVAVAGAQVDLEPLAGNYERARRFLEGRPASEPAVSTLSDERGRFVLEAPESGLFTLTVRATGFLPMELVPLTLTEPRELPPAQLPADAGSRVEVHDSRGEALAHAWIFARRAGMPGAQGWAPAQRLVRTGEDGAAVLPRADGERLDIALYVAERVHFDRLLGVTRAAFTVPPATGRRQSLEVRAEDGTPLSGVVATLGDDAWPVGTTDERGRLSFPALSRMPVALRLLRADGRRLETVLEEASPHLILPAAEPVAGRVLRESDRRPVAGALVWQALDPGTFVRSDEQGRYALALAGGRRSLRAEARGFLPARVDAGNEILMAAARPALGRVIDVDERPVAGAEVLLRPAGSHPRSRAIVAATSEDGSFKVSHLPATRVDVLARRRGYAPTFARGLLATAAHGDAAVDLGTLILVPGTTITGTVRDAEGEGIPGVGVWLSTRLEESAADLLADETGAPPDATTDGSGCFAVEDLDPGAAFHLLLRGDGYLPAALEAVTAPPPKPVTVVLERGAVVRGRVLNGDEEPVAGATVTLGPPPVVGRLELPRVGREHQHKAVTEADGSFRFDTVAVGPCRITADAEGYLRPEPLSVEIADKENRVITLVLERGATLRGRVTTADDRPVVGARILAGNGGGISNRDGYYLAVGLPLGRREIEVRHPVMNVAVAEVEIREGENVHDFELETGNELSGRVTDDDGAALAGVHVELEQQGWENRHYLQAWSAEDGTFHFPEVAAGRYQVRAQKSGYAAVELPEPVTVAAAAVRDVEVVLPAGTVIRGLVRGLDFNELAGIEIEAEIGGVPVRSATVDYQSAYEIRDLGPGDWLVRARTPGGQREAHARVTVAPGDRELQQDLEFGGGYALDGWVLFDGQPLPGTRVSLTGLDLALRRRVLADHAGGFCFRDLPAGSYRLSASHPRQQLVSNQVLDIAADEQVTIEIEGAKVQGYVRAAGGGPLAGARIGLQQVLAEGDGSLYSLSADAEGYFALPRLTAGRYRIRVHHDGYEEVEEVIELVAGVEPAALYYDLDPTAGLELQVTLADAWPSSVSIHAVDATGAQVVDGRNVEEGGRVRFPTLPAGTWKLEVTAPGAAVQELTVTVPGEPVPLVLTAAGRLQVRVPALVKSDRTAALHLLDLGGEPLLAVDDGVPTRAWQLRAGVAAVDGVPPGQWIVQVTAPDGQAWNGTVTTAAEPELRVSLE